MKSPPYINPPPYQTKSTTPPTDTVWPLVGGSRPASNSFSEVENQQKQIRINPNLSSSFSGSSSIHHRNQTNFLPQTLYAINQSTNEDSTPPTRKRLSLADFPVEEIKGIK